MTHDDDQHPIYDIAELATLGGVTRRTVRYYVQRGLIPPPTGTGRGRHYTRAHLDALVRVRELQAAGATLAELEQPTSRTDADQAAPETPPAPPHVRTLPLDSTDQSVWLRLRLGDDLELLMRRARALDSTTVARLAEAIRAIIDDEPDR